MATPEENQPGAGSGQPGAIPDQVVAKAADKVAGRSPAAEHVKRGPGRPPKPKAEIPTDGKPAGAGNNVPAVDPDVVKRAIESLCKTADRYVTRKTYNTAFELTGNQERAKAFALDVAMSPEELQTIPEMAKICAQQYGLLGEHTPAILLTIMVGGYAGRTFYALNKLEEIAQLNAAAPKAGAAPEAKIVAMPTKDADKPQSVQTPGSGN